MPYRRAISSFFPCLQGWYLVFCMWSFSWGDTQSPKQALPCYSRERVLSPTFHYTILFVCRWVQTLLPIARLISSVRCYAWLSNHFQLTTCIRPADGQRFLYVLHTICICRLHMLVLSRLSSLLSLPFSLADSSSLLSS